MNLPALPAHSLSGFHVRSPPGSQHSDPESKKKKRKFVTATGVESTTQQHCFRLQKHYSCPATMASTQPCPGTASDNPAPTWAGAR